MKFHSKATAIIALILGQALCLAGPPQRSHYRISSEKVCSWTLSKLGETYSNVPDLVAASPDMPNMIVASSDGRIQKLPVSPFVKSGSNKDPRQLTLFKNEHDIKMDLRPDERITVVEYGRALGDKDEGRIIIGTSQGRLGVMQDSLYEPSGVFIRPLREVNDGEGPVHRIDVFNDGMHVLRGGRASAHLLDNGEGIWKFNATAVDRDQTHAGRVNSTDYRFLEPAKGSIGGSFFVTGGEDGVGRVYVQNKERNDVTSPLRLLTPQGRGEGGKPIDEVAIAPTTSKKRFVTADGEGTVLLYERTLARVGDDRSPPTLLLEANGPIRQMGFSPSESVPKLMVVDFEGKVVLHRIEDASGKVSARAVLNLPACATRFAWVDNDHVLIATDAGQVQKWDVRQIQHPVLQGVYEGHTGAITSLELTNGGKAFVTTGVDRTVRTAPLPVTILPRE